MLETLVLSVLNHDCAVAAAAARMVTAARGRPLIEMGSRRTHEEAAVAAARAAYLAGFALHLQPGGRAALRHPDRRHRRARVHAAARRRAGRVRLAGRRAGQGHDAAGRHVRHQPGHPQRDRGGRAGPAGDPDRLRRPVGARRSSPASCSTRSAPPRRRSSSPATWTSTRSPRSPPSRSTCTAPAPRWSPAPARPTAGLVYKLVEVEGRPVVKRSENKATVGGRKTAVRRHKPTGTATEEIVVAAGRAGPRSPTTGCCSARSCVGGEPVRDCRRWTSRREHLRAVPDLDPVGGPEALRRRPGHPGHRRPDCLRRLTP